MDGAVLPRVGIVETIKAAMEHPHYKAALPGPNRGRGVGEPKVTTLIRDAAARPDATAAVPK